jgi:hypothetical protein
MAGVAIASYPPAEEDIAQAHTAAADLHTPMAADLHTAMAVDLHTAMAADQATARDTGLLHAQAYVPATHIRTSDVPLVHVPVVDGQAADSPAEDVPEAVARAVPDSWL